jgi:hypothetical protein
VLKLYITTAGVSSSLKKLGVNDVDASKIAIQATGIVSWRRPDIKYRKNEAFVDVIESINLIMSPKGRSNSNRNCSVIGHYWTSCDAILFIGNAGM